jgi:hypothetical protein
MIFWSEKMVAVVVSGSLVVYDAPEHAIMQASYDQASWEGHPVVWRNGRLTYKPDHKRPFLWAIWDPKGPSYRLDLFPVFDARCRKAPKFVDRRVEKFQIMARDFGGRARVIVLPRPTVASRVEIEHGSAAPIEISINSKSIDASLGKTTLDLGGRQRITSITAEFAGAGNLPTAEVTSIIFR